ncbi:amidase [Pseudomonas oryzihabitans]|uniref:amidase n=1 Tax=Pseudomonas oryzihabitans TaxID=47885 RepID=UPI002895937F|nr:amidase family protein [Pseudomonas oryzihabitans]MDT3722445.1 amidase family protein [Pseudomonas oryzihabitans]
MTIVIEEMALGGSGPTVMVKDTIDVAGYPTRASSRALQDAPLATRHAVVIEALLAAGCRLTAKVGLHELAFGTTGINHYTGTPENPHYPGRIPGGSSSSSATAVAAGLCDFALGTDTGGSVRVPACCCGVFGFKPTFGRLSRAGVMPAQSSLDCVGPLAADLPRLIQAMQLLDPTLRPLPTLTQAPRLGVIQVAASAAVTQTLDALLAASELPQARVQLPSFDAAYTAGMAVINHETWTACGALVDSGLVGADVAGRLRAAAQTDAADLAAAETVRARFTAEVDAALQHCDVLVLPTMPDYPLAVADAADTRAVLGMTALVRPFNLSGHPALSMPFEGFDGLPVGVQLVAAKGADESLLAIASELARRLAAQGEPLWNRC